MIGTEAAEQLVKKIFPKAKNVSDISFKNITSLGQLESTMAPLRREAERKGKSMTQYILTGEDSFKPTVKNEAWAHVPQGNNVFSSPPLPRKFLEKLEAGKKVSFKLPSSVTPDNPKGKRAFAVMVDGKPVFKVVHKPTDARDLLPVQ
ncbi:MAG: hypothetical protein QE263_08385 [Vampirovibrionales bacterium]|nr:hypothetical protein [Vampirovibrionales bacterium]